MAKKKYEIFINDYKVSASDVWFFRDLSTIYTLAAVHERNEGHLQNHEKYLNIALQIRAQIGDLYE